MKIKHINRTFFIGHLIIFFSVYALIWNILEPLLESNWVQEFSIIFCGNSINFVITRLLVLWVLSILVFAIIFFFYKTDYKFYFYTIYRSKFNTLLEKIGFDAHDTNLSDEWSFSAPAPEIKTIDEFLFGKNLSVIAESRYFGEHFIKTSAQFGGNLEYCIKGYNADWGFPVVYARVQLQTKEKQNIEKWMAFTLDIGEGKFLEEEKLEYIVFKRPEVIFHDWMIITHNIKSESEKQWKDHKFNKILNVRIRGNMDIAYIKVYK